MRTFLGDRLIDTFYANPVSARLDRFKKVKDGTYNFRCPYCGDSQKHLNKARGYFFTKKSQDLFTNATTVV